MSRAGLRRHNAKRDANEPEIVEALRTAGAGVTRISAKDVCDLLVIFRGVTYLIEVKVPKGVVSEGQSDFIAAWNDNGGKAAIVRSVDEALAVIGATEATTWHP